MKRIYHMYPKWECYPAGLYENRPKSNLTDEECEGVYHDLLANIPEFEAALARVTREWKHSCEHYLSNDGMNRIAWLGQAALCIAKGIPAGFRGGFNLLTPAEQERANESALKYLNNWLAEQGEPSVTMEQAGIKAKADRY